MSWGNNELGQLGNGNREYREKPKFVPLSHPIIQISAGSQHVVALTRGGLVLTWGGNRKGQLGDGQFTSRCEPSPNVQLRHRPVISVFCGENHTLVLTSGGCVYSWGDNRYIVLSYVKLCFNLIN
jgi:alpha-tubulin suppressor-like RCC1 family protein